MKQTNTALLILFILIIGNLAGTGPRNFVSANPMAYPSLGVSGVSYLSDDVNISVINVNNTMKSTVFCEVALHFWRLVIPPVAVGEPPFKFYIYQYNFINITWYDNESLLLTLFWTDQYGKSLPSPVPGNQTRVEFNKPIVFTFHYIQTHITAVRINNQTVKCSFDVLPETRRIQFPLPANSRDISVFANDQDIPFNFIDNPYFEFKNFSLIQWNISYVRELNLTLDIYYTHILPTNGSQYELQYAFGTYPITWQRYRQVNVTIQLPSNAHIISRGPWGLNINLTNPTHVILRLSEGDYYAYNNIDIIFELEKPIEKPEPQRFIPGFDAPILIVLYIFITINLGKRKFGKSKMENRD